MVERRKSSKELERQEIELAKAIDQAVKKYGKKFFDTYFVDWPTTPEEEARGRRVYDRVARASVTGKFLKLPDRITLSQGFVEQSNKSGRKNFVKVSKKVPGKFFEDKFFEATPFGDDHYFVTTHKRGKWERKVKDHIRQLANHRPQPA